MIGTRWAWAAAWVALAACGCRPSAEKADTKAVEKATKVTAAPVVLRDLRRTVEVVGSLRGWEEVELGAKRGGRVAKVLHDMGDEVAPGELLAELDPVDALLNVDQSQRKFEMDLAKLNLKALPTGEFDPSKVPSVVRAKLAQDRANLTLSRERSLRERGGGTAEAYDFAVNDQRSAVAAYDDALTMARSALASARGAQSALDAAKQGLADLKTLAPTPTNVPVGGPKYRLRKRSIAEGQMVKEGESLFELVIVDPLRLWTTAPERHLSELKVGQSASVRVQAFADHDFPAEVARVNPAIDPSSRTFQVELLIKNPKGELRPGGFARATIDVGAKAKAPTVPLDAVVDFAGNSKVFLMNDQEGVKRVHEVKVVKGQRGPGWIEVVGDVPGGARVVLTGQGQLFEGALVELREAPTKDAGAATAALN